MTVNIQDPVSALLCLGQEVKKVPPVLDTSVRLLQTYDPSSPDISQEMKDAVEKIYCYLQIKKCFSSHRSPDDIHRMRRAVCLFDQRAPFQGNATICQLCVSSPFLCDLTPTFIDCGADPYDILKGIIERVEFSCDDRIQYENLIKLIETHGGVLTDDKYIPLWHKVLDFNLVGCSLDLPNIKIWILRNLGDKIDRKRIQEAVNDIYTRFIPAHIENPAVIDIIHSLLEMRQLPSFVSLAGSPITFLHKCGEESLRTKVAQIYEESYFFRLKELEEHICCFAKQKMSFLRAVREKDIIKNHLSDLNLTPTKEVQKLLESLEVREKKAIAWIEEHRQLPIQKRFPPIPYCDQETELSKQTVQDIVELCLDNRLLYHLIPLIYYNYACEIDINYIYPAARMLNHLLLEKCVSFLSPLAAHNWDSGGSEDKPPFFIPCIYEMFHEISLDLSLSDEDRRNLQETLQLMIFSIANAYVTTKEQIAECLARPHDILYPPLFFLNTDRHAMLAQIQGNVFTIYNSGMGLQHHPVCAETGKHQTYLRIHFSEEDVEKLTSIFNSDNCNELYRILFSLGSIKEADSSSIHYEQPQLHGSCSTQCFLSYFRERILSSVQGSDQHKLGVYKHLKTKFLAHVIQMNKSICDVNDDYILPLIPYIEAKEVELHLEESIRVAAQDKELFLSMMQALGEGISSDIDTPHERYAVIRRALRDAVYKRNEYPELPDVPGTAYIKPLIDHLWQEKKQAERFLDSLSPIDKEKKRKKLLKWAQYGVWWASYLLKELPCSP